MVRSRLFILGLLLLGTVVTLIVYQVSSFTEVHTKILPSDQLLRESEHEKETVDEADTVDDALPTADGVEDDNLERLGSSNAAQALRQQAIANRKRAAKLRAQQKRLAGDIFKFKIEKSRQEGLRQRLQEDLANLKEEKRMLHEENKALNIKYSQETSVEKQDQPKNRNNQLSVQGAGLKRYLRQMSQNIKHKSDRNNPKYSIDAVAINGGNAAPLAGRPVDKLPMIEDFVQQGHFGYEHGRNGKSSSRQKSAVEEPRANAKASANSNEAAENTQEPVRKFDPNDLWEGRNPTEVVRRWSGIMLDGTYMLRPFIDVNDKRASGMEGKPQSLDYMSEGAAEERFYQLITVDHLHCDVIERMGNYGDGGWDMCSAPPYKPGRDCLVYSFGINNDFSFDDGISHKYGCEVKAFDPSMNMGDHMHSSKVHFFNLGLGPVDGTNKVAWQLRTFGSILIRLGHSNHVIDFLKVDIEFNEWDSLKTALAEQSLRNVKQLVLEIHTSEIYTVNSPSHKPEFLRWYNILLGLEKQGFRRYHHHFNPSGKYTSVRTGKERTCCYELYYINIRFLK